MKIPQYCSVCKAEYEMDVVPTGDDDGVLWLQCPVCKGYLPKVKSSVALDDAATEHDAAASDTPEPDTSADETTAARATASPGEAEPAASSMSDAEPVDLDAITASLPDVDAHSDDEPASKKAKDDDESVDDPDEGLELLEAADVSTAVSYRPWQTYEIGDILHHLAWDDHGVVLDKEQLPGNRRVLKVRFAEAGLVRLIEDDGSRPA